MSKKRILLRNMALATAFTVVAAPAWAQAPLEIDNKKEMTTPVNSGATSEIKFTTDGAKLIINGKDWTDGTSAIVINDGESLSFTVNSGATGALAISGATAAAIYSKQATVFANLDLSVLKFLTLKGNENNTIRINPYSDEGGGGGIFLRATGSNQANLTIGDYAIISGNKALDGGGIYARANNGALNVTLGDYAVFSGNKAQQGAALWAYSFGGAVTVNLGDNLLVSGNKSEIAAKGAAGAIYIESSNSSTPAKLTIGNNAMFYNNSAGGQRGYGSVGGAISMPTSYDVVLTLGQAAEFIGNSLTVADNGSGETSNSGGGAIGSASANSDPTVIIGAGSLFADNRAEIYGAVENHNAYYSNAVGGGAIFLMGHSPVLTVNGNTRFENNSTTQKGGAIIMSGNYGFSKLNLDTALGDIAFTGNKHDVTAYTDGKPNDGTANSIYFITGTGDDVGNAKLNITGAGNVFFDDPIAVDAYGTGAADLTLDQEFGGFVQFQSANSLSKSDGTGAITVAGGTLRLAGINPDTGYKSHIEAHTINMAAGTTLSGNGTVVTFATDSSASVLDGVTIAPDSAIFTALRAPTITGYGTPYAADPSIVVAGKARGELMLNTNGFWLIDSTLAVDLGTNNESDLIKFNKLDVANSMNNSVNISTWANGNNFTIAEFTLLQGSVTVGIGTDKTFNTDNLTVDGMKLGGRMAQAVDLKLVGNKLKLETSLTNKSLTWSGTTNSYNDWNFTVTNKWNDGSSDTTFAQGDKVTFGGSVSGQVNYKVGGTSNASTSLRIQVSDMEVNGGHHSFAGGALIGRKDGTSLSDSEGKLTVTGQGTHALFDNTVDFEGGIQIKDGAETTVRFQSDAAVTLKGFVTSGTSINVDASSKFTFDVRFDQNAKVPVYVNGSKLEGDGTITADIINGNSPGYLMLTSDKSTFSGTLNIKGNNSDKAFGVILANARAAGDAKIKFETSNGLLGLDFGRDDGFTHDFSNKVTGMQGTAAVEIHSGRIALGGLTNFNDKVNVLNGGVLAFNSDDSLARSDAPYSIGSGNVTVNLLKGGAIVGGDGSKINGTLKMETKSILEITAGDNELTATNIDLNDAASVARRLQAGANWTDDTSYAVLKSNNVTGNKNVLAGDLSTLISNGSLSWGSDGVLYYNHGNVHTVAENNGLNRNQMRAAFGVDSLDPGSALYNAIINGGTAAQAGYVMDQVSGQLYAAINGIMREAALSFGDTVTGEVRGLRGALTDTDWRALSGGVRLWANTAYDHAKYKGDGGRYETTARGPQLAVGIDKSFTNNWFAGAAFQYGQRNLKMDHLDSKADVNSYTVGIYGGRDVALGSGALRFTLGTAYSWHDIETDRGIAIATLNEKLKADYNGASWLTFAEAAYGFKLADSIALEPYLNLAYVHQKLDGFTEKGGMANLKGKSQSNDDLYTTLGARFNADITDSTQVELGVGLRHRFGGRYGESTLSFAQGSAPFTVESVAADRDLGLVNVGVKQQLGDSMNIKLMYNGAYGADTTRHGVEAAFTLSF